MDGVFDFEKPIVHLEKKLADLRELAEKQGMDFHDEMCTLEQKIAGLIESTFAKLSPWQRVQLSRHPQRPYLRDYIDRLFPDFYELSGDRAFGEDEAILGGLATFQGSSLMIIGSQKGRTTKQKMDRNFGMARPEGYRKAIRLYELADRFKIPILTLIDTPGAYPGIDAEERGQSQAIAEALVSMFATSVPIVSIVTGEGGSGGALAIGIGNIVLMQEYSIYSVISPESCASILWNDASLAEKASEKLKMNARDVLSLGIIDGIVPEPPGGAHRNWDEAAALLHCAIQNAFHELTSVNCKEHRAEKFRAIGTQAYHE